MRKGLLVLVLGVSMAALVVSSLALVTVSENPQSTPKVGQNMGPEVQSIEKRLAELEQDEHARVNSDVGEVRRAVKIRTDESGQPKGFVDLTKRLAPAVVNIATSQTVEIDLDKDAFPKNSPLERFNDFFGGGNENRVSKSLGSGFVVDKDGYIVTNNHVIEGADTIDVAFPNGDSFEAELIGRDPSTDVALLKVDAGRDLPFVNFAGPDSAQVGEWVIAIGNPLGYSSSVAAGIVSARHRNISMGNYDDFIQTDVAINKGNSGGPLFDMNGDVIGVNTAIVSPTGYSVGLSFSIPADLASGVVEQLREYGETRRGFLGVTVQPVTADIAKSYDLKPARGALIRAVTKDSPANKAGLERGDLITDIGGKPLKDSNKLARIIADSDIDAPLRIDYIRKRKHHSVDVTIERLKEPVTKDDAEQPRQETLSADTALGVSVDALDDKDRKRYRLDKDEAGVKVTNVSAKSDALGKLKKGDLILEVAQEEVFTPKDFEEKVKEAVKDGDPVVLLVSRGGLPYFYTVKPVG